jgi:diguanylate cyclase (GGDEF)-like protein
MRRAAERRIDPNPQKGIKREQLDRRRQPLTSVEGQLQRANRFLALYEPHIQKRLQKIREHYAKFGRKLTPEEENYWRQITYEALKKVVERAYVRARDISDIDNLTKLYTESKFRRIVEDHIIDQEHGILFMIDLNNLKLINDTKKHGGHKIGDKFIYTFAQALREIGKEYGLTVCRSGKGADEFLAFSTNNLDKTVIDKLILDLRLKFRELWSNQQLPFPAEFSIGYSSKDEHEDINDPSEMYTTLREFADGRMYDEKKASKKGRK